MQRASQSEALTKLLVEAAVLAQRAQGLCSTDADGKKSEAVRRGLEELAVDLRHLRDGIHDAAIDPEDDLAVPRLEC